MAAQGIRSQGKGRSMNNPAAGGKKLKRKIRELCGTAYEREMRRHLDVLFNQFHEWSKGALTTWDLVDHIHTFHDGNARKLYNFYQDPNEFVVAYAVSEKLIELSDVPEELRDTIRKIKDSLR